MILYNPIVTGADISIDGKPFPKDSKLDVSESEKEKYPFLVDLSEEKYSPDYNSEKIRINGRSIVRGIKRIFNVLG